MISKLLKLVTTILIAYVIYFLVTVGYLNYFGLPPSLAGNFSMGNLVGIFGTNWIYPYTLFAVMLFIIGYFILDWETIQAESKDERLLLKK